MNTMNTGKTGKKLCMCVILILFFNDKMKK